MKKCEKCLTEKEASDFVKQTARPSGLHPWCSSCRSEYRKENRKAESIRVNAYNKRIRQENPEKVRAMARARYRKNKKKHWRAHIKQRFGITEIQYEAMYRAQNGLCGICFGVNINGQRLSVDHNHQTGKIRALLCARCNTAIGLARENAEILKSAIDYLEKYKALDACGVI